MEKTILSNVADIIMGQSPPGETYNEIGIGLPFFQGVADFGPRFPRKRVYCSQPTRIAKKNDILISVRAPIGRVNIANFDCAIGRGLSIIRAKNKGDFRFIEYSIRSLRDIWDTLEGSGSVFGNAKKEDLEGLQIPWIDNSDQRYAVGQSIGTLDDKIELNRRMNSTLEEIASALFKHWFVDNPEAKGWEIKPLPEIIDVNPIRSLRKGEIAPYLDMANMPMQGHRAIHWIDRPFGSGTKFENGDTLLARITPCLENGKTAYVDFLRDGQTGWGSTEYIILRPKPPLPPEYGYYLARSDNLRNHAIQNMTGTSGRQRTPASCFDNFDVPVPPVELANQFGDFAQIVMRKIKSNDEQSRTLASLLETLLPRLMRGEVRVRTAD
jgi:type I restriction enzyme S subunit